MSPRGRLAAALLAAVALVAAGLAGYALHGDSRARFGPADAEVGAVDAHWSCDFCGTSSPALPALSFSQGSCPRRTIAVGNAHDSLIRAVLPAGTYRVSVLLPDGQMIAPERHDFVTVRRGETSHLGTMRPDPHGAPYPMFCD